MQNSASLGMVPTLLIYAPALCMQAFCIAELKNKYCDKSENAITNKAIPAKIRMTLKRIWFIKTE